MHYKYVHSLLSIKNICSEPTTIDIVCNMHCVQHANGTVTKQFHLINVKCKAEYI